MNVVLGFDDAVSGWIQRLARTSLSASRRWNFTSDTLGLLHFYFFFLPTTVREQWRFFSDARAC